jgi:hypothetical protein
MIGGVLVGLAFVFIAALRGGGAREPRPFWARSEAIESLIAVLLVAIIALGLALVVSSVKSGWVPLALGSAVALAGMIVAITMAPRRAAAELRSASGSAA